MMKPILATKNMKTCILNQYIPGCSLALNAHHSHHGTWPFLGREGEEIGVQNEKMKAEK